MIGRDRRGSTDIDKEEKMSQKEVELQKKEVEVIKSINRNDANVDIKLSLLYQAWLVKGISYLVLWNPNLTS